MIGVMTATDHVMSTARPARGETPATLLFLIADTGGGHRNAALAVSQALGRAYPGQFAPVLCDPLAGPGSARLARLVTSLYGPLTRLAPWLWGAAYHASDSRAAMWLLRRTLLRLANRPAVAAVRATRPAAIVSFHALAGAAAVRARDRAAPGAPVVTVVTDLARAHTAWRYPGVDAIAGPPAAARGRGPGRRSGSGPHLVAAGLPVTRDFWEGPLELGERATLRRSLALDTDQFLVLLTGGGEGSGGIGRQVAAILRRCPGVGVIAVCGRNRRLRRRLDRLAARAGGRLTVTGFTPNMADWLRCCDVVAGKAGPGTIAEASCCGTPMLLTSHLPGQESGNAELVAGAGAGRQVRGVRGLLPEVERLRDDRREAGSRRAAAARLARPGAAHEIAHLIASLAHARPRAENVVPATRSEHSHAFAGLAGVVRGAEAGRC